MLVEALASALLEDGLERALKGQVGLEGGRDVDEGLIALSPGLDRRLVLFRSARLNGLDEA